MVKRTITITTILLVLSIAVGLIIALNRASFAADDDIASGTSGTCSWVIDKDGVLTISPTDGVSGMLANNNGNSHTAAKWYPYRESITKVIINTGVKSSAISSYLFYELTNCTEMDLTNLDTSNTTEMGNMFAYCSNLTTLDVTNFNTSKVTSMFAMFRGCNCLTNLNLIGFNTSKVTSMYYMFCGCEKLTNLDVTSFNTSNVINMGCMFGGCNALTSIDVTGFDTHNVSQMGSMFSSCENLTSIDLSNFNTSSLSGDNAVKSMFENCFNIKKLDLNHFNTSAITNFQRIFTSCNKLEQIDIKKWNVSNGTNFKSTFEGCKSLTSLDLSEWETSSATTMTNMFRNCISLTNVNISNFDTYNVNRMEALFANCSSLRTIDISSFDTRNVTSFNVLNYRYENLFENCNNLNEIVLGEQFDFDGNNINSIKNKAIFPATNNPNYTDRWIREDGAYGPYTVEELRNNYDGSTMAGTWIREIRLLTVTYKYTGIIPQNASDLPEAKTYSEGEEVIVAPDASAPGYTFSGWSKRGTFTMPAEDIVISGYFIKDDVSKEYKIEYYFDGEKDDSLDETMNAEIDEEILIDPQKSLNFNNTHYSLVSENHKINVSENTEDNVIKVYYETDVLDYKNEESTSGDGISDKYQVKIVYKVQNGTWNDGTSENKKQIINLHDKDGNPAENGTGKITIPEVGSKPNEGYKEGSWNIKLPNDVTSKDNGKEFIYSYAKIESISEIKGNLSNPKTDDIVQRYAIYGVLAILLMLVVKKTINKYSRKKKKIQF